MNEIKELQDELDIKSDFIFCNEDGEWIKTDAYHSFLRRLCQSKGFKVTNNHALRMSLNSNVLIRMGITAADRAAMLGPIQIHKVVLPRQHLGKTANSPLAALRLENARWYVRDVFCPNAKWASALLPRPIP